MIHVGQQSAHNGCQGDLRQLSLGPKALVESAQYRIATGRAEGGHVQGQAHFVVLGSRFQLAENSTPLWLHHSILRSDETWLPEWSGNLGGVQWWRSSVARVLGASQSFGLRRQASWLKVWRGGGCNFSATERAHKRNGDRIDAECRRPAGHQSANCPCLFDGKRSSNCDTHIRQTVLALSPFLAFQ